MTRLLAALAATYALTLALLAYLGIRPDPPWGFVVLMALVVTPLGILLVELGLALERACAKRALAMPAVALAVGMVVAWQHRFVTPLMLACALATLAVAVVRVLRESRQSIGPILVCLGCLVFGYAAVWNLNYVVAHATAGRLQDATLRDFDLALFSWIGGRELASMEALFPLVSESWAFSLLENCYAILFTEIAMVVVLLLRVGRPTLPFLLALFGCYGAGLLVFLVYPTVGPCIFEPNSFRADAFPDTFTLTSMRAMSDAYVGALQGGSVSGAGYFVALPSLHVAVAALLQRTLRFAPAHFWLMVPANVLLAASTVVLGFHYVLDVPAGVAVALIAGRLADRFERDLATR